MAPPKGHKFSVGHGHGRPREHDRDQIALDLIEWAKKDDSINLNAFCCSRDHPLAPSMITNWARECDNFKRAYEFAKTFLGVRREKLLNNGRLHVKAYDLNACTYDYFLAEEKREQKKFEASLEKDESKSTNKVVFEVNYKNDGNNSIEISPQIISTTDSTSTE